MKRALFTMVGLMTFGIAAAAQEQRNEIGFQGMRVSNCFCISSSASK